MHTANVVYPKKTQKLAQQWCGEIFFVVVEKQQT